MNTKNVKRVLVDYEERMSREQAATLLESIASKLREEGSFTLNLGNKSQFVQPAEMVNLEIELEEKGDRKSTRLNSSHVAISYAVFCLKKKTVSATKKT